MHEGMTELESFRAFYKRTTGYDYPGEDRESVHLVMKRVAEALADWADELARRKA